MGPIPREASSWASPSDLLEDRLAVAQDELSTVSAGAPLCRIDRGPSGSPVKAAEGRVFALVEVRRRGVGQAAEILAAWQQAFDRTSEADRAWHAYRGGGVEELKRFVADLR